MTKPFNVGIATSITIFYFMVEAILEAGVGALASDWLSFAGQATTLDHGAKRGPESLGFRATFVGATACLTRRGIPEGEGR
ncbi:hypothetical protein ACH47X_08235 [Promicromonospora kroppenstedtii]|uniref:Uncharacterized protein n=1 Tax=Promicromonospora kroppenstedtii TaxID=440482 RepID=A0ABW7XH87_9MICO